MDDGCLKTSAKDARRLAILEVAREVFMEDGFAAASMSTIAARVGGSKGTLYNYFPSKEGLFIAVIQNECDLKQAAMFDSLEADGEVVVSVLRQVGRRYTHMVLSEQSITLSRVVIAESTRFPELGRALYEAGPKRGRRRLKAYLTRQMQAGHFPQNDAGQVVDQFCDLCMGALYRKRLMNVTEPPDDVEVNDRVETALMIIMAAYGPARVDQTLSLEQVKAPA